MRCLIGLLGILLLGTSVQGSAAPYRFQALIDRDRSAESGCDAATPAGVVHGTDVRVTAETDRETRLRVVSEVCVNGEWRQGEVDSTAQALGLGQGRLASDRIEWPLPRALLFGSDAGDLRVFGEHTGSGAYDVLGEGNAFAVLAVLLGGGGVFPTPAPALSLMGAMLLVAVLLLAARRRLGAAQVTASLSVLFAVCLAVASSGSWAGLGSVTRDDHANDSVGLDAGVDLLSASIVDDSDGLRVRIEVNNIEADGLPQDARVLFIGNSLTYVNDLPGMFRAVAAQAGKTVTTGEVTAPNFSLEDHYQVGDAQVEIDRGYTVVIMQQGPSALPSSQTNLEFWALKFNTLIRRSGAQPALYMVWPERARFNVFDDVRSSYANAALAVDGLFLPGGEAWRASWSLDPSLALYGPDDFHPSELGTYAVAVSIFAELYRQTPLDLPSTLVLGGGSIAFDAAAARTVQRGAWQAHLQFGRVVQ